MRAIPLLGLALLALTASVPLLPSASATPVPIVLCQFGLSGNGGVVGQTIDYVNAEATDNCQNTVVYAFELCQDVFGPGACTIE